jgi:hypothetical protein
MLREYRQLIQDVRAAALENHPSGKILLTAHHFERAQTPSLPPKQIATPSSLPPPPVSKITKPQEVKVVTAPVIPSRPVPVKAEVKAPAPLPQNDLKQLLRKVAPHMRIVDEIPSDESARKIVGSWKEEEFSEEVALLFFEEIEEEILLIRNLGNAINTRLKSARVLDGREIERENKWGQLFSSVKLRFIISSPLLSNYPLLMQHYQERGGMFLAKIPLHILDPVSSYLTNPALKISLWQKLSTLL